MAKQSSVLPENIKKKQKICVRIGVKFLTVTQTDLEDS